MKTLNEYLAMPYRMEIVEDREEGGFVVSFPELPGCITCGETLETDSSAVAEEKGDLACERYVLDNDKLQVEVLANLDKVQPAGAVVIVSYPRIEGATGLPARVWAITE